jgi:hypothetical protein
VGKSRGILRLGERMCPWFPNTSRRLVTPDGFNNNY